VRWRLNRRLEYAKVPDELKAAGQDGYLGEYLGDMIVLRRDLDHADESMAMCHELMHVVLHAERSRNLWPPASRGDSILPNEGPIHRRSRPGGLVNEYRRVSVAA
jgi:hypothetical protein